MRSLLPVFLSVSFSVFLIGNYTLGGGLYGYLASFPTTLASSFKSKGIPDSKLSESIFDLNI